MLMLCFFDYVDLFAAIILGINANPVFAKDISTESSFESSAEGDGIIGLRKVEDGSVISNIHTSKWRIFTDNGRDFFLQASISGIHGFVIFITLFAVLRGFLELSHTFCFVLGKNWGGWKVIPFCDTRSKRRFWREGSACCICMQQSGGFTIEILQII